jgi:hypothetical protein
MKKSFWELNPNNKVLGLIFNNNKILIGIIILN